MMSRTAIRIAARRKAQRVTGATRRTRRVLKARTVMSNV